MHTHSFGFFLCMMVKHECWSFSRWRRACHARLQRLVPQHPCCSIPQNDNTQKLMDSFDLAQYAFWFIRQVTDQLVTRCSVNASRFGLSSDLLIQKACCKFWIFLCSIICRRVWNWWVLSVAFLMCLVSCKPHYWNKWRSWGLNGAQIPWHPFVSIVLFEWIHIYVKTMCASYKKK